MDSDLHQQLDPSPYRPLQPQQVPPIHNNGGGGGGGPSHLGQQQQQHHHQQHHTHTLASQGALDLSALQEHNESVFLQQQLQSANEHGHVHVNPHVGGGHNGYPSPHHGQFDRGGHGHRPMHVQSNGPPHTPQQQHGGHGQFGMLTSNPIPHNSISRLQQEEDLYGPPPDTGAGGGVAVGVSGGDQKSNGHLSTKIVIDPPNLEQWRQKLFDVNDMITLSEEQFETYFPHVDNVYSHRSTQRYKKKPFVSHYWDCRLKGRPPGTPKSDDPNKKKRKRTARERDLCDVKIKITEYFPGAMLQPDFQPEGGHLQHSDPTHTNGFFTPGHPGEQPMYPGNQHVLPMVNTSLGHDHPGASGARFYTIQRVNGNGGNGKGDGVPGPHKHNLAESDHIKKNSVQREILKKEKEEKKTQRSVTADTRTQKIFHKKATGTALATVRRHSKDNELKLYGSCFCPWVQRVWIALEAKGIPYQYIEVDPLKKPQSLLEIVPRGSVPGIRHGNWGCGESTVLMEYLEDLNNGRQLLPNDNPQIRATCRLWADHINHTIIPTFYALLRCQDYALQSSLADSLRSQIDTLVDACDRDGPYFLGPEISWVDIFFAPWMLRLVKILKLYRNWQDAVPGSRWAIWIDAVLSNEHVRATTSSDELYTESHERWAQSRTNNAGLNGNVNPGGLLDEGVGAGMGLP